jgi:uncharacterized membrane protein
MDKKETRGSLDVPLTISNYLLLYALIAFLGWSIEVLFCFFESGKFADRGFLTLPLCPIYPSAIFLLYFTCGVPRNFRGALTLIKKRKAATVIYVLLCFIIPSAGELLFGYIFDKFFGVRLWDYSYFPFDLNGYICLAISLLWGLLLFLFMAFVFERLKGLVFRVPRRASYFISVFLIITVTLDAIKCFSGVID